MATKVLKDLKSVAREEMRKALEAKTVQEKIAVGYEVKPEFIRYVPKKGPNAGKAVVKVGFKSKANPDSSFLAIKLYPSHAKAIVAAIDAGHKAKLLAMLDAVSEHQEEDNE